MDSLAICVVDPLLGGDGGERLAVHAPMRGKPREEDVCAERVGQALDDGREFGAARRETAVHERCDDGRSQPEHRKNGDARQGRDQNVEGEIEEHAVALEPSRKQSETVLSGECGAAAFPALAL